MAKEKKEFAWDSEMGIGMYDVSEKEQHSVSICTLNGSLFLVDTKMVERKATGWTPVKFTSIPVNNMENLMKLYTDWKLGSSSYESVVVVNKKKAAE